MHATWNVQHAYNVCAAAEQQSAKPFRHSDTRPLGGREASAHFHGHLRLVWSGLVRVGLAHRVVHDERAHRRAFVVVKSGLCHRPVRTARQGTASHGRARRGVKSMHAYTCPTAGGRRTNPNLGYAQEP